MIKFNAEMQKVILGFLLMICSQLSAQDVKVLNLKSNDVIYLPTKERLYVSTSEGVGHGNSICVVNPYFGTIDTCYTIGGSPGVLAFSNDEKYIYIGLLNSPEIVRFDVDSESIGLRIPLGGFNGQGAIYAEDIAVVPDAPTLIAVALMNPNALPWHAGVAIYQNAVRLPNALPASMGSNSITFDSETGFLYGYRNETNSELAIRKMRVSNQGVSVENTFAGLLDRVYDEIKYSNGKLYSHFGKVINLESEPLALEGSFDVGVVFPVVEPMPDSSLVFFLNSADAVISLEVFDKASYSKIDQSDFPNIRGNPYKLIQWGGAGKVAFITRDYYSGYQSRLVILRSCVSAFTEPPNVDYMGPSCLGDTIRLYADGHDGPIFWSDGQSGSVATLAYSEVIFCSIADQDGCLSPSSSPLLVSFNQYPEVPFIYPSEDSLSLYSSSDYIYGMQWFRNGTPIPEADSTVLEILEPGTYSFQVNWEGCLSAFSNEIIVSGMITDLDDQAGLTDFALFPNPASDRAYLRLSELAFNSAAIHISNMDGKLIRRDKLNARLGTQEISLEGLPSGLYFIRVVDDTGRQIIAARLARM